MTRCDFVVVVFAQVQLPVLRLAKRGAGADRPHDRH
jgi:hypothetical protein